MNEFTELKSGKELIVRKKVSGFIEKALRGLGLMFDHDKFKKIIYGEEEPRGEIEELFKNLYDAYYYLISNHKRSFTKELLNKFFYILHAKLPDEAMIIRLTTNSFLSLRSDKLDDIIKFHLEAYKEMVELSEFDRTMVALMFLNYGLLKLNMPTIKLLKRDVNNYLELRKNYILNGDKSIFSFIYEIIINNKFQDKSYYKNLKELKVEDLINVLKKDKEFLQSKGIKSLFLFGSFAKGVSRIDSDIDLLFTFNQDKTREELENTIAFLKEYYFNKFERYIDFSEISDYLSDEFIKEINVIKTIFTEDKNYE